MPAIAKPSLLQPISPNFAAGEDLRLGEAYDKIRQARSQDDPDLPQGVWVSKLKQADWQFIQSFCLELLETRTKDLQIAAWLVEANLHLQGFPGLENGLTILLQLTENFWENAFPGNSSDDLESRVAPFYWLNEKVSLQLKFIPLVEIHSPKDREITIAWHEKKLFQPATKATSVLADAETITGGLNSELWTAAAATNNEFYLRNIASIENSLDLCARIEIFLQNKASSEAPTLRQLRDNFEAASALMSEILDRRGFVDRQQTPHVMRERSISPQSDTHPEPPSELIDLTIRTREEAYQVLSLAADYLQQVEPHSPVPYLIRRALRWGSLSFEDVLPELVKNPSDLKDAKELLGIGAEQK